ncbi:MAG TPA: pyridoxal 5'-phosphate synthase glutaminase subunit PdxT, partial [Acidothermaceae bacterium]|nr:pyridoxal 5'-phosphate synthase glutaminase subunit PdxT [Acidothermaceae bacterium]
MISPRVGVLALQGDVREHLAGLAAAGAIGSAVRRPAELDAVDALVVPGGESTTMYKLAIAFDMFEPLRDRLASGMPAYGSCAGMVMLADRLVDGIEGQVTLGGLDMTVRRNAFGRQIDSFEADVALSDVEGAPFHAVFIRAPWVDDVGAGVSVVGRLREASVDAPDASAGRIVAVRQGVLLATAFHPELT